MNDPQHKMYYDLAAWYTTLTPPEDYEEEAVLYHEIIQSERSGPAETLLELGAGSGNNAFHLKQHYTITLTDLSPAMIAESQKQNPECTHHIADMRTIRLDEQFDVVFIHDAIDYMTTFEDLTTALETAALHCKPGGLMLVVPDFIRETFEPATDHGGGDHPRSMRFLEWTWHDESQPALYFTEYVYVLREGMEVKVIHERHTGGLFSQAEWLEAFAKVGLNATMRRSHIEGDGGSYQPIWVAKKPDA